MFDVFMKQMGRGSRLRLSAMLVMLVILLIGCGNASDDHSPAAKLPSP